MENNIYIKTNNNLPPIKDFVILAKSFYNSGDIISERYLSWQYLNNPFGLPFYSIAFDNDLIIGQYIIIPIKILIDGEILIGSLSLNTLTHPNYQGKGLFIKLAKETYKLCSFSNVNFTIGFPNPLSHKGFINKLNFDEIITLSLLFKPLKLTNLLSSIFYKNNIKHGGDIFFNFETNFKKNIFLRYLSYNDSLLFDKFWNNLIHDKITLFKDFNYIKWRYLDNPHRLYHPIISLNNGIITSLCILRIEKVMNINTAIIMDFFTLDNSTHDAKLLMRSIFKSLKNFNISIIISISPNVRISKLILNNLFFFKIPNFLLPQKIPIIFKSHIDSHHLKSLKYGQNWNFSFGDYDIF